MSNQEILSQYKEEPVTTSYKYPLKLAQLPWFDVNIVFALIAYGEPRSGKSKMLDWCVDVCYKNGFNGIWLHSALGFENLFATTNLECRSRWQSEVADNPDKKHNIPACQCFDVIPSIWIIPDYIDIDPKSIKVDVHWKDWNEYHDAWLKNIVSEYIPQWEWTNIEPPKKPKELYPKQPLKVMHIRAPHDNKMVDQFRADMYKVLVTANKENRLVINSPAIYPTDDIGKIEKYSVVGHTLKYLQDELYKDPYFARLPRKGYLTPRQLSNHKFAVFLNEIRACCPSQKFSGERQSSISKRMIYNFMPERRHARTWVFADSQSPDDIFDGVRNQFSQLKIFKRITIDLIGKENEPFMNRMDKAVEKLYSNLGYDPKKPIPTSVKMRILERYHICKLSEIPDNWYCLKLANGEFKFREVKHARFHHKDDTKDEFFNLSGIKYSINPSRTIKESTEKKTVGARQKKDEANDKTMIYIQQLEAEGTKFKDIPNKLSEEVHNDTDIGKAIDFLGLHKLSKKSLNNRYNRWKKAKLA